MNFDDYCLTRNPQNQKTKTLLQLISESGHAKVAHIIIIDNAKEQAVQLGGRMDGFKVYELSTNKAANTSREIEDGVALYALNDVRHQEIPVIVALSNKHQCDKVMLLLRHFIQRSAEEETFNLEVQVHFDEADKTYPRFRAQGFADYIDSLSRVGWITATPNSLLAYPECEASLVLDVPADVANDANYRGAHHPETVCHFVDKGGLSGAAYALSILENGHFDATRKVMAVVGRRRTEHVAFAHRAVALGCNVLTFNQLGVTLYRAELPSKTFKLIKPINLTVREIYEREMLQDKLFVLAGDMKLDRGSTFHDAPRDGSAGFLFTDMICPKEVNDERDLAGATQTFGRIFGIIAHCPQYAPIHLWGTERTLVAVKAHCEGVDEINRHAGEAVERAFHAVEPYVRTPKRKHACDITNVRDTSAEVVEELKVSVPVGKYSKYGIKPENKIAFRGGVIPLLQYTDKLQFLRLDIDAGLAATIKPNAIAARIMPVMCGEVLKWVGIFHAVA